MRERRSESDKDQHSDQGDDARDDLPELRDRIGAEDERRRGRGRRAADEEATWFVADWGVVTLSPFRARSMMLEAGRDMVQRCTTIVHDGEISPASVEAARRGGFGPEGEAP